tara:strand:- start:22 stop:1434 length:1413 start_codon:yes stop_codon:yes gene_type:complete
MSSFILVYPNIILKGIYKDIIKGVALPPQGICQIAAILRQKGHQVKLIDALVEVLSANEVAERITHNSPDFVGFSSTTMQIDSAHKIAEEVKKKLPQVKTLIGGPHVSALPEETMKRLSFFDYGFIGESEHTIIEFVDAFSNGKQFENVTGLVYKENETIKVNPKRKFIENLDKLPLPAWDLLPNLAENYQQSVARVDHVPAASVTTSRGCPCKCIFCARNVYGISYRGHSDQYVIKMIEFLIDHYGMKSISFEDENFTANKKRLRAICERVTEKKYDLTWSCAGRIDMVNEESLRIMKKAGCTSISYGIESGSQRILDILGKKLRVEKIREGIKNTSKAGIRARGYFIIGNPAETFESIKETEKIIMGLPFSEVQISFMTPFPGTDLYDTATEYGEFNNDWAELNIWTPNFIPKGLNKEILIAEEKRIMRKFYFRPKAIAMYLQRALSHRYFFKYFKDGFTILKFLLKK